jgi:surface antigen
MARLRAICGGHGARQQGAEMGRFVLLIGAIVGSGLAACANDNSGAARPIPASNQDSKITGASFMLGGAIGAALDDSDRQRAYAAEMQALQRGEPGVPVGWRSRESGHHGTVVPGPLYQENGQTCREFSHTVYVDANPQIARGTACRNADGSWTPVG